MSEELRNHTGVYLCGVQSLMDVFFIAAVFFIATVFLFFIRARVLNFRRRRRRLKTPSVPFSPSHLPLNYLDISKRLDARDPSSCRQPP